MLACGTAGSSEPEEYNGGRTADDFISFVNTKLGTNYKVPKAPSAVVELDPFNFDSIVGDPTKHKIVEVGDDDVRGTCVQNVYV